MFYWFCAKADVESIDWQKLPIHLTKPRGIQLVIIKIIPPALFFYKWYLNGRANHYIVNFTFKISYMLAFASLHFPWRVNFCTFCYLVAKYMNRVYEKRKQIEEVEEKYVCPIACMIKSIQHTSILFGNLRQRFNPFCIENIYTTTTYFNGIQQSFKPSV